jgi:hypothetical protein
MVVALTKVNDFAAVPPKVTAETPVKLVPFIVTVAPVAAAVGVKEVIVGAGTKVNSANEASPPAVVTMTLPVVPAPTTAVIVVELITVKDVAAVPPKLTAVVPKKFVPLIVSVNPSPPLVGSKEVIVGAVAELYMNPVNVAVPPAVVTVTLPEVPAATTAVMVVALTTVKDEAAVPPKATAVAPVKFVPLIVTVAPVAAAVGVKDVIVGVGT